MEWWPFDDEGSVGRGSIGSLSYYWVPVTTRLFQGQSFILIRDIASVSCECNGAGWSTCTCALKECGTKGWCMKNQVGVAGRVGFFVSVCKPGLWVGVKTKQEKKKKKNQPCITNTMQLRADSDTLWASTRPLGVGGYTEWIIHHTHLSDL